MAYLPVPGIDPILEALARLSDAVTTLRASVGDQKRSVADDTLGSIKTIQVRQLSWKQHWGIIASLGDNGGSHSVGDSILMNSSLRPPKSQTINFLASWLASVKEIRGAV